MSVAAPPRWRNRIVRSGTIDPEQIIANPMNWRIHPTAQQQAIEGSLDELGWAKRVILQDGSDLCIDGHARVMLALRRGEREIPADWTDHSDDEVAKLLTILDPVTGLAVADREQLEQLLDEIETASPALQELHASMAMQLLEQSDDESSSGSAPPPDVTFREFDESVEEQVKYQTCPDCGHRWAV